MMKTQRGNILFLILLAVVLFAALSYAVTGSTQGGGKNASDESTQASAAELMNFFTQMSTAVQRMMLVEGIRDYELNFYTGGKTTYGFDNANCTASRCRVFNPAGGNIGNRDFKSMMRPSSDYSARMWLFSVPGVGTSKPDLLISVWDVKLELCTEINKRMGITTLPTNVWQTVNSDTFATGQASYASTPTGPFPDTSATLNVPSEVGQTGTFCACGPATLTACAASHHPAVYHVLVAR